MKFLITALLLFGLAAPAWAIDKSALDKRIRMLTAKFEEMQAKPDKRIPAENLRKAQGIILLDRTKAGFIFAYQGGGGLAMVKDAKSGQWSPPAFVSANEASLGLPDRRPAVVRRHPAHEHQRHPRAHRLELQLRRRGQRDRR